MATQVLRTSRRSQMSAALVALALALAAFVLAIEARSTLSSATVRQNQPAPVHVRLNAEQLKKLSRGVTLPAGCRVKYGCEPIAGPDPELSNTRHIPAGCRVKFGCQ
jgi:hypothetical protein